MLSRSSAAAEVEAVLRGDPVPWRLLGVVRDHGPPGGWITAGCIRNAVWDRRHGRPPAPPDGDVDVVWFDPDRSEGDRGEGDRGGAARDREHEAALRGAEPGIRWSVKNQARIARRNGDTPCRSVEDALRHRPDTATAVAARRTRHRLPLLAPFGLDDLVKLWLRPTPRFREEKRAVFEHRINEKGWCCRWHGLRRPDGRERTAFAATRRGY